MSYDDGHDEECGYPLTFCQCDMLRERDARVRADEREKVARDEVQIYARAWDEISDEVFQKVNDYDHAEAVAARLVEVICEQDAECAHYRHYINVQVDTIEALEAERDAARAEVERLRSPEWEAEVRADERERQWEAEDMSTTVGGRALRVPVEVRLTDTQAFREFVAHAESVSGRLVEVICEDAAEESLLSLALRYSRNQRDAARLEADNLRTERDAARAEVDRLNIEIGKAVDSRERTRVEMGQKVIYAHRDVALARAEVAALRELVEVQGRNIRRETLDGLARAIDTRYQDIKGQPGHDRNPEYWDGVLDGLDIAEQIVEKEADRG